MEFIDPIIKIDNECYKIHNTTWPLDDNGKILISKFNDYINNLKKNNNNLIICDIGAQSGCFSLLSKIHQDTIWYSFEPVPTSFKLLTKNLEINNIKNVNTYNIALSNVKGIEKIKIPTNKHLGLPTLGKNPPHIKSYYELDVSLDLLDNILEKVNLVKIDVEGAELLVLDGMKNIIKKNKPVIFLEVALGCLKGFNKTLEDFLSKIEEINYKVVWADRQTWKEGGNIIIESK